MKDHDFSIQLKLRIDWSDLDYFKHVNNVSFFRFIQAARVNYWDQIGLTEIHANTNHGPMLASCKCDFKSPLFYPGEVTISSTVDKVGNSSFQIHHYLFGENGALAAEAVDIVVMFDFNKNEKISIPKNLRTTIEKLENKTFDNHT